MASCGACGSWAGRPPYPDCPACFVVLDENFSEPVASFDIDAQTLIGVLQAGLMRKDQFHAFTNSKLN
jgi:hypothetical protein